MQKNIKFVVVREDPLVEASVIKKINAEDILIIASGGCTALSLQMMFSEASFTLFDMNPAQIKLVKNKIADLKNFNNEKSHLFNIEYDNSEGLNGCGEFESLFRSLRAFINEFILHESEIRKIFIGEENKKSYQIIKELISHKY